MKETKEPFSIFEDGLLIHSVRLGSLGRDEYAIERMRSIVKQGGLKFKNFGYKFIDFNLSGAKMYDENEKVAKVGFGQDKGLFCSGKEGYYDAPFIFVIDSLKKLYPNYSWQILNNFIYNGALEQFSIRGDTDIAWPTVHLDGLAHDWRNPPDLTSEEDPFPNLPRERRNQRENLVWYEIPTSCDSREYCGYSDGEKLASIKRTRAIVIPRKIGKGPNKTFIERAQFCDRPQQFFLEELIKAQEEFLEPNQRIPIYDNTGVCMYAVK